MVGVGLVATIEGVLVSRMSSTLLLTRVLGIHCECFGFKDVIYIYITEVLVARM